MKKNFLIFFCLSFVLTPGFALGEHDTENKVPWRYVDHSFLGASLALAGHSLILLRFEFSEDFKEVEGKRMLYHGVMRFRALTQKIQ